MALDAPDPETLFGRPHPRIDGVAKVTGAARYPSDEPVAHAAYAFLVTSAIARGRIAGFDLAAARAVPGFIDILTFETLHPEHKPPPDPSGKPTNTTTLEDNRIWHDGQIIAVVVAETFEAAREAAHKVGVRYAPEPPSATFDRPGVEVKPHKPQSGADPHKGDEASAFAAAPVRIDQRYSTPTQHHNPIELFTTTCVWDGPKLTIYEPTQFMWGLKTAVAKQLGIDPANVRTVSRFVGGAFGSKGSATARTALIAQAAKRVGRPVKLVATRDQGFTIATYRAETRQHLRLGATRDGKLVSLFHEGWEVSSRPSDYNVAGVETTARMYACPNIATAVNVVHADRNTPGFMRAPPDTPYMFALESGMDELAHELGLDPIELRRINDTQTDPVEGRPFSSRSLMRCFDEAAARFGWSRRSPKPGGLKDGDWLVGYGCATACYPSNIGPAAARLTLTPDGRAHISLAGHEIGTGAYTTVALTVAHGLGIPVEAVSVTMGDSDLPPVPVAGGSNNAASTAHVALKACELMRAKLLEDGIAAGEPVARAARRLNGALEVYAENVPAGLGEDAMKKLYAGQPGMSRGTGRKDVTAYAFGAHFVETRVHARTREIRTPRVVSAFASGTIVNPLTAYSQYMGGAIWGLSSALHEATELDQRAARYINDNLADYLIPVNADVPSVEVILVPEHDASVNPLGIKGIGEIGIVGMNAAVANAVFNATGKRIRDLPIRAEKLL